MYSLQQRNLSILPILSTPTCFSLEKYFSPDALDETLELNADQPILIVGAGALGCAALKNAVMCGYSNITVLDMDTIELSNLNRQFMYCDKDVGQYKAEVAAAFVKRLRPYVKITALTKKIQDYNILSLRSYQFILICVDNNKARYWINAALLDITAFKPTKKTWKSLLSSTVEQNQNIAKQLHNIQLLRQQRQQQEQEREEQRQQQQSDDYDYDDDDDGANLTAVPSFIPEKGQYSILPTHLFFPTSTDQNQQSGLVPILSLAGVPPPFLSYLSTLPQLSSYFAAIATNAQSPPPSLLQSSYLPQFLAEHHIEPSVTRPVPNLDVLICHPTRVDSSTAVPFAEGGTEGWDGSFRSVIPFRSACLQCGVPDIDQDDNAAGAAQTTHQVHTHMCTIAAIPRVPEHCIMYTHQILWPRLVSFQDQSTYTMAPSAEMVAEMATTHDVKNNNDDDERMTAALSPDLTAQQSSVSLSASQISSTSTTSTNHPIFETEYEAELHSHVDFSITPNSFEPPLFDKDNTDHLMWIVYHSQQRALQYNVSPLPTYAMVLTVLRKTIPAIASTNTLIASLSMHNMFQHTTRTAVAFSSQDASSHIDSSIVSSPGMADGDDDMNTLQQMLATPSLSPTQSITPDIPSYMAAPYSLTSPSSLTDQGIRLNYSGACLHPLSRTMQPPVFSTQKAFIRDDCQACSPRWRVMLRKDMPVLPVVVTLMYYWLAYQDTPGAFAYSLYTQGVPAEAVKNPDFRAENSQALYRHPESIIHQNNALYATTSTKHSQKQQQQQQTWSIELQNLYENQYILDVSFSSLFSAYWQHCNSNDIDAIHASQDWATIVEKDAEFQKLLLPSETLFTPQVLYTLAVHHHCTSKPIKFEIEWIKGE